MLLGWFDSRQATNLGIQLADQFAAQTKTLSPKGQRHSDSASLSEFFRRAHPALYSSATNFFKKAKLANSFKWRLIEHGVESPLADQLTQTLITQLSLHRAQLAGPKEDAAGTAPSPAGAKPQKLLTQAAEQHLAGDYAGAIATYETLLRANPRHPIGLNNIGAPLCRLGRYDEAERHIRKAISLKRNYADAHANLGSILRMKGQFVPAEDTLRKALRMQPGHQEARVNLGLTLQSVGRSDEAKAQLEKVLQRDPSHREALLGMGNVATSNGKFDEAEAIFRKILSFDASCVGALAALVRLRKMTDADESWLERAQELAATNLTPDDEATLLFAIGKFLDDVGDFPRAFKSYERANEILKSTTQKYAREEYEAFVGYSIKANDPIAIYDPSSVPEPCLSTTPVFVLGMMRSGTSLTEQIIASHPDARGAGELDFWSDVVRQHGVKILQGPIDEGTRAKLATAYLAVLKKSANGATRVVDKTPVNSDYLGLIHAVFPNARIIYMRRSPIDTCLSCYFQQFVVPLSFTLDLSDLAHYYRQHHRLFNHWRRVLPQGAILEVPYEELISDQEVWTRRILEFIGLGWSDRCMAFHSTARTVATASYWQVRQRIYKSSVERWRNYKKFLGPLRDIEALGT